MSKKFTLETIKNLKVKVKDLGENLTHYYTSDSFIPADEFRLSTETCDVGEISDQLVQDMIIVLEANETEFEAGKILYENLRLSPKEASDICFWTYQNHYKFYPYISARWKDLWENVSINANSYVINHWIQTNTTQGDLIDYPISGLWWSFYLTVDDDREDKYELTKVFFKNLSIRTKLLGTARFARHKPAILGILEFIKDHNLDNKSIEQAGRAIVPYINLLGGIRPLTYFDKDWFKEKLNARFGEQIEKGEKLFMRPGEADYVKKDIPVVKVPKQAALPNNFSHYFCLNSVSGIYNVLSETDLLRFDYCLGLNLNTPNQYIIHFYREGKIKKTKIEGGLSTKVIDRQKPYSNGMNSKMTLYDIQIINEPVLFGIAYKTRTGIYFKAMNEQIVNNFRNDNTELMQEGKKVLYIDEPYKSAFKILPAEIMPDLRSLVKLSPTSDGTNITNNYYSSAWTILKKHWPELFDDTVVWN